MWIGRTIASRGTARIVRAATVGAVRRGLTRLERDPVALRGPADDRQPGRRQGGPDLILAVDEDPRGEQAPVRPELGGEPGRERRRAARRSGSPARDRTAARRSAGCPGGRANRRPRRLRRALARASPRSRSDPCRGPGPTPAPSSAAAIAEDPRAAADVEDADAGARPDRRKRPSSAQRSIPARHSRVVGWRPVPNAMPGSSARTTSRGVAPVPPPGRPDDEPAADAQDRESAPSRRAPSPPRGRARVVELADWAQTRTPGGGRAPSRAPATAWRAARASRAGR